MDAKLKADWIAALRSGEYRQGKNCLQRGDTYCCLGVLACVIGAKIAVRTSSIESTPTGDSVIDSTGAESGYSFFAPFLRGHSHTELTHRNDRGDSFKSIADYIEANIPADDHSVAE